MMTAIRTTALLVVLVAIVALPAMAQTPRMDATGYGFAAVSVDETASFNNPAGLPLLDTFGTRISPWPSRASLNFLADGPDDLSQMSAFYAGRAADNANGWGVGYIGSENGFDSDDYSLGYGQQVGNGLTVGASVFYQTWDAPMLTEQNGNDDSATSFDLGAIYRREMALNAWRFGLWVEDVADEYGGPLFHVGAAVELPAGVQVGATLYDLTDEFDSWVGIGAEWAVPMSPAVVRVGSADGELSAGAGWRFQNFEINAAWTEVDGGDDMITAGATGCF